RYNEAFEDFNKALKLNSDDWRIYSNRALTNLRLDRYVDAIADCNRIIDLKKDNSETYLLRGEAKAGLEMYKVAVADFERAMEKDSLNMRPVLHRGIARTKLKQFELALADFNQAMLLDTASALPLFHRGVVHAEMGKQQDALQDFERVLRSYPDNAIVLFNRAMVYSDMGRQKQALEDYEKVIRSNPKNILAYYNRAILHLNSKNYALAAQDLKIAIDLFPEFLEAHENLLICLSKLGKLSEYEQASARLGKVRSALLMSDEDTKVEQSIRLAKLTELKGDFESVKKEVGKVQYRKVDVQLLPYYRISPFPETEKNISVYDGFNRPYYDVGVIAFTTSSKVDLQRTRALIGNSGTRSTLGALREAIAHALLKEFDKAYVLLDRCVDQNEKHAACLFARGLVRQMELDAHIENYHALYGDMSISDTSFQKKTELLISLAEADYHLVLELDKEMRFTYYNLGHLMATAERYEEAEMQFGLAAGLEGNFIEANYNRGLIRILLGKLEKGCEDMSLAGELGLLDSYSVIKRFCE
ncbi:MAG: DUF3808 domain-containing protein, partial [Bacteroidetes bacterium]